MVHSLCLHFLLTPFLVDILNRSNDVASISIDALGGLLTPFKRNVNELRNQSGQMEVADYILNRLSDSEMVKRKRIIFRIHTH